MQIQKIILFLLLVCLSQLLYSQIDIPDEPEFISASVIPESNPVNASLRWNPSDSLDVVGYIIYKVVNTTTETIDTVWGRQTVTYTYQASEAAQNPERFRLAAFDDLYYKSKITDPHTTMFLNVVYDKCSNRADLTWTAYSGWDQVSQYNIYRRTTSDSYQLIKSVPGSTLQYADETLELSSDYIYYVEAVNQQAHTATSNSVVVITDSYAPPQFMYALYASVTGMDIELKFILDNSGEVLEYRIQRSSSATGPFTNVRTIQNNSQGEIVYTDTEVDPDENIYYYRLVSVNPCGEINSYSNICSNILLNAEAGLDLNHNIDWSPYQDWQNGVFEYRIHRYFDNVAGEIAVNTPGNLNYQYDISWYVDYCHNRKIHLTNKFCYYVEAYENQGHTYTSYQGVSRSNISCVQHMPVVWIPNAFNVTSYAQENKEFKPVLSFVEKEPYEFIVFDRYGIEVFRSNETYLGWNGYFKYTAAPSQYYIYLVRYFDHKNKEHIKTGTFFLFVD